jgi:hypothetical protein
MKKSRPNEPKKSRHNKKKDKKNVIINLGQVDLTCSVKRQPAVLMYTDAGFVLEVRTAYHRLAIPISGPVPRANSENNNGQEWSRRVYDAVKRSVANALAIWDGDLAVTPYARNPAASLVASVRGVLWYLHKTKLARGSVPRRTVAIVGTDSHTAASIAAVLAVSLAHSSFPVLDRYRTRILSVYRAHHPNKYNV